MATNETTTNNLVDKLRRLVDVIERENLQLSYVVVNDRDLQVSIGESDFRKIFKGKSPNGIRKRDSNFVDVEGEAFGLVFISSLYFPKVIADDTEVNIQL